MKPILPPTDTRRRPDQTALETGDLKFATDEKNRLEEKQRAVRKYKESMGLEHRPIYFEREDKPDGEIIYQYKGGYWEDREKGDWSHLMEIFSEELPAEMKDFA